MIVRLRFVGIRCVALEVLRSFQKTTFLTVLCGVNYKLRSATHSDEILQKTKCLFSTNLNFRDKIWWKCRSSGLFHAPYSLKFPQFGFWLFSHVQKETRANHSRGECATAFIRVLSNMSKNVFGAAIKDSKGRYKLLIENHSDYIVKVAAANDFDPWFYSRNYCKIWSKRAPLRSL